MAINDKTMVSLKVMLCVAACVAAWADIRWQVKDLRREVEFLQVRMSERWTKVDDAVYMQGYSTLNELKMLAHTRVDP